MFSWHSGVTEDAGNNCSKYVSMVFPLASMQSLGISPTLGASGVAIALQER